MRAVALIESVVNGTAPAAVIESLLAESFKITSKDLSAMARMRDRDLQRNADDLLDYLSGEYESPYHDVDPKAMKRDAEHLLDKLSTAGQKAVSLIKGGHVDQDGLKRTLIGRSQERLFEDPWPIPVYVSSGPSDRDTIGLIVHENGKLEMFEGNDEASPDTIELVNDLLGLGGKKATVYASHNEDVVDKIKQHNELPANLYVSPNKSHAAGYWGEDRVLFSCEISMSAVSQESHVDWRTLKPTKINKFRYA